MFKTSLAMYLYRAAVFITHAPLYMLVSFITKINVSMMTPAYANL